jgi:hypothetical protein
LHLPGGRTPDAEGWFTFQVATTYGLDKAPRSMWPAIFVGGRPDNTTKTG